MTEDEARQVLRSRVLSPNSPIEMVDGRKTTVAGILAEPHEYHEQQCFDPIEEDERGVAVVLSLPGEGNFPLMIISYKNGKTVYHLQPRKKVAKSGASEKSPTHSKGWEVIPGKGVFSRKEKEGEIFTEFVCSELRVLARTEDVSGRDIGGNDGVLVELQHQREKDTRQLSLADGPRSRAPELKLDLVRAVRNRRTR